MKKEELYDQFAAKAVDAAARTAFEIGLQRGHEQGFQEGFEAGTLVLVEPTLKYHPLLTWSLTSFRRTLRGG